MLAFILSLITPDGGDNYITVVMAPSFEAAMPVLSLAAKMDWEKSQGDEPEYTIRPFQPRRTDNPDPKYMGCFPILHAEETDNCEIFEEAYHISEVPVVTVGA